VESRELLDLKMGKQAFDWLQRGKVNSIIDRSEIY
jgi:hypothetical protein